MLNFKIISLTVTLVLFFESAVCGAGLSDINCLRVPMDNRIRFKDAYKGIKSAIEKTKGLEVVELPNGLGSVDIYEQLKKTKILEKETVSDLKLLQSLIEKTIELEAKKIKLARDGKWAEKDADEIHSFVEWQMSWLLGQLVVKGILDFDDTVKELWDDAASEDGVFSYDPNTVLYRDVGKWKVRFAAGRASYDKESKKRALAEKSPSVIPPPYDPGKNFNKFLEQEGPKRRLLDLVIDGKHIAIDINKNPSVRYHMLIIPEPEKEYVQFFNEVAVDAMLSIRKLSKSSRLKIGFNPSGKLSSVNHLHLQTNYYDDAMPIEDVQKGVEFNIEGVDVYTLTHFCSNQVCFKIDQDQKFKSPFLRYIGLLQDPQVDIAHPISMLGDFVYVWPEVVKTDEYEFMDTGLGTHEQDGFAFTTTKEDFDKITAKDIEREIKASNISDIEFNGLFEQLEQTKQQTRELLPVYDFVTRHQIGVKERSQVHHEGDWHHGIQAYVITTTPEGKVQVLVQKRSDKVDISKGKYDQSLATQVLVEDRGNLDFALKRGLLEELDIREDEIEFTRIGGKGWLRVMKKYDDDPTLYNREYISLYLVMVNRDDITSMSPKVAELEWVDWDEYVSRVETQPEHFTKTSRFYILDPLVRLETERAIQNFIQGKPIQPFPFRRFGYVSYPGRYDVSMAMYYDYSVKMNVYDYVKKEIITYDDILSFDVYEGKDQDEVAVRITTRDGVNYIWQNGQLQPTGKRADEESLKFMEDIIERFNKEIRRMQQTATPEQLGLLADIELKFYHNLKTLWSRVMAGDVKLSNEIRGSPEAPKVDSNNIPEDLVMIALPGTFDPTHLDHIDLLLDTLVHISEQERGIPKTYVAFISPVGDNSPGPDGKSWKTYKSSAEHRHNISKRLTDIFDPLIQTSFMSLTYPDSFGTENAIRLLELNRDERVGRPHTVTFYIAAGSDTFIKWRRNFDELIRKYQGLMKDVNFKIIVRQDPADQIHRDALQDLPYEVIVLSDHYLFGIHSTDIRTTGRLDLLPESVKEYIKQERLYNAEFEDGETGPRSESIKDRIEKEERRNRSRLNSAKLERKEFIPSHCFSIGPPKKTFSKAKERLNIC